MSTVPTGNLLLFVSGDPDLRERLSRIPKPIPMMAGLLIPPTLFLARMPQTIPPSSDGSWLIPADQVMCVELVAEAIRASGRTVKLVDVNRPGDDRGLVQQYVSPGDILPILLRPDGARLEGVESFTPSELRRFVRGP